MTTMTKDEERPVSERKGKLNVSVRPRGSVLTGAGGGGSSSFCARVHVRFESRRQKSNYRLLLLRGTPKANVSFPREELEVAYYPTERFILRISIFCKPPFIGALCLHQFETVRARTMIVAYQRSRTCFALLFFFLYKRNIDSSHTSVSASSIK